MPDVSLWLIYIIYLDFYIYSYMCNQCTNSTVKTVGGNVPAASVYHPTQERWRTAAAETTQSERCYTVSPVLHIITCCFTADGTLSKPGRGRGRALRGRLWEEGLHSHREGGGSGRYMTNIGSPVKDTCSHYMDQLYRIGE